MTRECGTVAAYVDGCRCEPCTTAVRRYEKIRRRDHRNGVARIVPSWRAVRRIEALGCMGYAVEELRRRLGYTGRDNPIAHARQGKGMLATSFEKFDALYQELCMLPYEPSDYRGRLSRGRTIARARREGWASCLAWDDIDDPNEKPNLGGRDSEVDEVVVQRILDGDYSIAADATKAERIEVVARWRADGRSLKQLEAETGWRPDRYVTRTPADVRRIIERSLAS